MNYPQEILVLRWFYYFIPKDINIHVVMDYIRENGDADFLGIVELVDRSLNNHNVSTVRILTSI